MIRQLMVPKMMKTFIDSPHDDLEEDLKGTLSELLEQRQIDQPDASLILFAGLNSLALRKTAFNRELEKRYLQNPIDHQSLAQKSKITSSILFTSAPVQNIDIALKVTGVVEEEKSEPGEWIFPMIIKYVPEVADIWKYKPLIPGKT